MSALLCQISAILVSGCILAAGGDVAQARMSGPQTFKPAEGVIKDLGSKRAIGYFLNVGGQCNLTLMISDMAGGAQPATSASLLVDLKPGQSVSFGSNDGETVVATCGAGGRTLEITRS